MRIKFVDRNRQIIVLTKNNNKLQVTLMAQEQQLETLDQTLEKTDFGHMINENKKGILIGGLIILLTIVGYSLIRHQNMKSNESFLAKIYEFEAQTITPFY